jgi:EmrB/QacA subfamily drug resistance transporter
VTTTEKVRPGTALALLCGIQFMVILDTTVTNVALDAIRISFDADEQTLQYVISLYATTFGGLLLLAGRTSDLMGRRKVFTAGTAVFGAASLACGLSGSMPVLLAARALQGAGAAFVSATAFALLLDTFPDGPPRNRALGIWSGLGASGAASGLILGGVLTDAMGWQLVFFVNVPPCAAAVLLAARLLPADPGRPAGLDVVGAVTVTLGLGALIFGVTRAQRDGFGAATTLAVLGIAAMLLAGFAVAERRSTAPLVPTRVLATGTVAAANLAIVCLMATLASQAFFLTLYLQRILHASPTWTGLAIAPSAVLAFAGSAVAARLGNRFSGRALAATGLGLVAGGQALLSGVSVDGSYTTDLLPGLLVFGFGLGTSFVGATMMATTGVAPATQGLISGLVGTAQQVGMAVGVAVLVAVAATTTTGTIGPTPAAALAAGYGRGLSLGAFVAAAGLAAVLLIRPARRPAPNGSIG